MESDKSEDVEGLQKSSKVGKGLWKPALFVCFLIVMVILFSTVLQEQLNRAIEYLRSAGALGAFLYCLLFLGIIIGIPSTPLEIGAAIVFEDGFVAFFVSTAGKNISCWISYWLARKFFQKWVDEHVFASEKVLIRAFRKAFEKNPVKIAFLWSGSYVPIWSTNYGLGSLGCPFPLFVACTFIVGLPYSILWVFVGRATKQALDASAGQALDAAQFAGIIVAIVLLLMGIAAISWFINKSVKEIVELESLGQGSGEKQTEEL